MSKRNTKCVCHLAMKTLVACCENTKNSWDVQIFTYSSKKIGISQLWIHLHLEVSIAMGVPLAIIHFRLGCSIDLIYDILLHTVWGFSICGNSHLRLIKSTTWEAGLLLLVHHNRQTPGDPKLRDGQRKIWATKKKTYGKHLDLMINMEHMEHMEHLQKKSYMIHLLHLG